jgi:hypothetical protein
MKLLEVYVKASFLRQASILIVGECVQHVFSEIYRRFAEGRVVLTCCPEAEMLGLLVGKMATLLACSRPKEVVVLTVDGSPHCFQLHAAVNQAFFITKSRLPLRHIVVVEDDAREVSPESVRVGRYLHLVQKCIHEYPKILEELNRLSLEHSCSIKRQ